MALRVDAGRYLSARRQRRANKADYRAQEFISRWEEAGAEKNSQRSADR